MCHILQIHYRPLGLHLIVIKSRHCVRLRLKHNIMCFRKSVYHWHRERWITARCQPHYQTVIYSTTTQREKELLYRAEMLVGSADITHTVHRPCTYDKLRLDGIVIRFMVSVTMRIGRQRILHPHFQCVESWCQRHVWCYCHCLCRTRRQISAPIVKVTHRVIRSHNGETYPYGVEWQRSAVLQSHLDTVILRRHRHIVVRRHQPIRCRRRHRIEPRVI